MSRGVNKWTGIGNVGADPEVRTTARGLRVGRISLATSRKWKDDADNLQEATEWHRLTVWGKLADVVDQFVGKGDRLYVECELRYSRYNPDGVKKSDGTAYEAESAELHVRELVMLGDSRGRGTAAEEGDTGDDDFPY